MGVTVDGVDAGNEDLVQTEVTLWRDGGKPITAEMTRRPLRVILPSGSHLVAYKVTGTDSSVPANFTVERSGDELSIRWKVFDPDMAIKVALVRSGSAASVLLSSEVGPGVVVDGKRYGPLKVIGLVAVWFLLAILVVGGFLGGLGVLFTLSERWERRIANHLVRRTITLVAVSLLIAGMVSGGIYEQHIVEWLANVAVKPIPLQ